MMKNKSVLVLLLSVLSLSAHADTPAGDGTAAMIQNTHGKIISTVQATSVQGTYWITDSAQKIIDAKGFDIADPNFELNAFNAYVEDTLKWALNYYSDSFTSPLTQMTFALDDLGDDRQNTACETYVNTRFVHCDVRRVHKMFRGYRGFLFPLVLVHEYTHANQYAKQGYPAIPSSSTPVGRPLAHDRELKAIAVEIAAIIQHDQNQVAFNNYVKTFKAGCTPAVVSFDDETLLKQTGRRCLLLTLWTMIESKEIIATVATPVVSPIPLNLTSLVMLNMNNSVMTGFTSLLDSVITFGLIRASDSAPVDYMLLKQEAIKMYTPAPAPAVAPTQPAFIL